MRILKFLTISILLLSLCSCTMLVGEGVSDVNTVSSGIPRGAGDRFEYAVYQASNSLGWTVRKINSSTMQAMLNIKKYRVVVEIIHNQSKYSIIYADSENLGYDAEDNLIYDKYNQWVDSLSKQITLYLLRNH